MKKNVIVIDAETTGLDARNDEILQLTIISDSGRILFNEFILPTKHTEWPEAERINHITYDMVKDCQPLIYHAKEIQNILDSADVIVGYNHSFDMAFLDNAGIKSDVRKNYDLMLEFSQLRGEWDDQNNHYKWFSLKECADYLGYNWGAGKSHDTLSDCKAVLYCYKKMISGESGKGGIANRRQFASSYRVESKSPTPFLTMSILLAVIAIVLAITARSAAKDSSVLKAAGITEEPAYNQYQNLLASGMLNSEGEYAIGEQSHNGLIHVTFANNPYMKTSYFRDAEQKEIIDTDNCYLSPGDSIYGTVELHDSPSSRFHFLQFDIREFSSSNSAGKIIASSKAEDSFIYKLTSDYNEISIIPVGATSNRKLSFNVFTLDTEGREKSLAGGKWAVNGENYNTEIGVDPYVSLNVTYELGDYNTGYYIANTSPSYTGSKDDAIIRFDKLLSTEDTEQFSVELHPYISVTIIDDLYNIITQGSILNADGKNNPIRKIWKNTQSDNPIEYQYTNDEIHLSNEKLKCGDEIHIHLDQKYSLASEALQISAPTPLGSSGTDEYTIKIPDSNKLQYEMHIVAKNNDAGNIIFQMPLLENGRIIVVRKSNGIPVEEGDLLPSDNDSIILTISPDEGYYISDSKGKMLKDNVYQETLKFSKYQAKIDEIIQTHPIKQYITVDLPAGDWYGNCRYTIDKKNQEPGDVELIEGQKLTVEYTISNQLLYAIDVNGKEKTTDKAVIEITPSMNGQTLKIADYFTVTRKRSK